MISPASAPIVGFLLSPWLWLACVLCCVAALYDMRRDAPWPVRTKWLTIAAVLVLLALAVPSRADALPIADRCAHLTPGTWEWYYFGCWW